MGRGTNKPASCLRETNHLLFRLLEIPTVMYCIACLRPTADPSVTLNCERERESSYQAAVTEKRHEKGGERLMLESTCDLFTGYVSIRVVLHIFFFFFYLLLQNMS